MSLDTDLQTVWLDDLEIDHIVQGWESAKAKLSVYGTPLTIAGQVFERGIGTHTVGSCLVALDGGCERFQAFCGVDDVVGLGQVRFEVRCDGAVVFDSGVMSGGEAAQAIDVDLRGVQRLELIADAVNDRTHHGHANWCMAQLTVVGQAPAIIPHPREEAIILTPSLPEALLIHGPRLLGVRPGSPLLGRIAATGTGPLRYAVQGLPSGCFCDDDGFLHGSTLSCGQHPLRIQVSGPAGTVEMDSVLQVGEDILLTPPLGWNSWNCCGPTVDAAVVERCAQAFVDTGLAALGWQYINIDDGWQGQRRADTAIPYALQANEKFPDMAALVAKIHGLGLKAGIYSVPNVHSPAGLAGGSADTADGQVHSTYAHGTRDHVGAFRFVEQDVAQYAAWGFDYIKYDKSPSVYEARALHEACRASGRDMATSYSAHMSYDHIDAHRPYWQCWRTTGDLIDSWYGVRNKLLEQIRWQDCARPGHWNDPDMLVIGHVGPGWSAPCRPTGLTPNEQYVHISMWVMFAAPMLLGAHPDHLDEFTLSLLRNHEVLAVHQDPLGIPARLLYHDEESGCRVWRRLLFDGSVALCAVNMSEQPIRCEIPMESLGMDGTWLIRDLWSQVDLGTRSTSIRFDLDRHHCGFVRCSQ